MRAVLQIGKMWMGTDANGTRLMTCQDALSMVKTLGLKKAASLMITAASVKELE